MIGTKTTLKERNPTASSRMKRGSPRVANAIAYGIRNAPGYVIDKNDRMTNQT